MEKYLILIERSKERPAYSMVCVYNKIRKEMMYRSVLAGGDILNFFDDLQIPTRGSTIDVSKGHPIFIDLKNLGYSVCEL